MKLNQKNFDKKQNLKEISGGYICNLMYKNYVSINSLGDYCDLSKLIEIDLSRNHLEFIEVVLGHCKNLQKLNLSMNHIKSISNLDTLTKLQYLDLSTNRIEKLENINNLKSLKHIDVSSNYLEEMENLFLPNLEVLIISCNQLTMLTYMNNLPRLKYIDCSKNELLDLNVLNEEKHLLYLESVNASYNRIPSDYIDDLCIILRDLRTIRDLDLTGNEVTMNPHYKAKILASKRLQRLDQIEISNEIIEDILKIKKINDYEEAVNQTNMNYVDRMKKENEVKAQVKSMLYQQIQRVDEVFEKFQIATLNEQENFLNYIKVLEKKKKQGNEIDLDDEMIEQWRLKIKQNEFEERQKFEIAKHINQQREEIQMQKQINGANLREKLYEIALTDPDLWREIKTKELMQVYREEQQLQEEEKKQVILKQEQENSIKYEKLEEDYKKNLGKNIQDKLKILDELSDDQTNTAQNFSIQKQNKPKEQQNQFSSIQQQQVPAGSQQGSQQSISVKSSTNKNKLPSYYQIAQNQQTKNQGLTSQQSIKTPQQGQLLQQSSQLSKQNLNPPKKNDVINQENVVDEDDDDGDDENDDN